MTAEHPASWPPAPDGEGDPRLEEAIARYLDRLNSGERLVPDDVLAEESELGLRILEALEGFIDLDAEPAGVGAAPPVPRTLGDYRLLRRIGRGGMGVVYEAWERSMDRRVALKVLPPAAAADDRAFQRFLREAKTAGRLSHPNVVPVYGAGVKDDTPYFAMQLIDGETLAQVLRKEPPAPDAYQAHCLRMAGAFADAAAGLHHAHSKGVVHRDIKPSNLILDREGRLRILDFGLARLEGQESVTQSGDFVGTPLYMSPEQARRRKIAVDHRTDVYSLGATLYEMLTWRPPFRGRDNEDTLSQIIERDPVGPRKLNPRVPQDLETIVLKCLRKEPVDRYGTAEALGQDLWRFIRGDPVEAKAQPAWEKLLRQAWIHRGQVITALLGILLLLMASLLVARRIEDQRRGREQTYRAYIRSALPMIHLGLVLERKGGGTADDRRLFSLLFRGHQTVLGGKGASGSVDRALETLEKAEGLIPGRPEAYYFRARGLWLVGRREEALRELEVATARHPAFIPAQLLRRSIAGEGREGFQVFLSSAEKSGGVHSWPMAWLEATEASSRGQWTEAVAAYGKLLDLEQGTGEPFTGFTLEARLGRGIAHLAAGEHVLAAGDFLRAEEEWRSAPAPSLLLGEAYLKMGDTQRAEERFRSLWETTSFRDEVAVESSIIYSTGFWHREALEWAERISNRAIRERARINFLVEMGRPGNAAEAALELLASDPNDPLSLAWAARGLAGAPAEAERALEVARQALQSEPHDSSVNLVTGLACQTLRLFPEAIERFQKARDADPSSCLPRYFIGMCLADQGEADRAIQIFQEYLEVYPDDHFGHNELGRCLWRKGEREEALKQVTIAAEKHPRCSWAILSRGRQLGLLGRLREGEEELRKAIRIASPIRIENHSLLAENLIEQGRFPEAMESLLAALRLQPDRWIDHLRISKVIGAVKGDRDLPPVAETVQILRSAWRSGAHEAHLAGNLIRLLLLTGTPEAIAEAEAYARVRVEETRRQDAPSLVLLARTRHARGMPDEAIALFEEARERSNFTSADADELRTLRRSLLPQLTTSGSIDQALEEPVSIQLFPEADRWPVEGDGRDLGDDIRWLLECLAKREPIRIDCGGGRYVGRDGRLWRQDCFWRDGWTPARYLGNVAGTEDELLEQTERRFASGLLRRFAYRFPLPGGRYRVRVHVLGLEGRTFGVLVAGREVLPANHRTPHAVVEVHAAEVELTESALDISLLPGSEDVPGMPAIEPGISAIEVERVE